MIFQYGGSVQKLLEAVSPTCAEFILECEIANTVMNGTECCNSLFDPTPTFSQYGENRAMHIRLQ